MQACEWRFTIDSFTFRIAGFIYYGVDADLLCLFKDAVSMCKRIALADAVSV
jgi:hypothetical protein